MTDNQNPSLSRHTPTPSSRRFIRERSPPASDCVPRQLYCLGGGESANLVRLQTCPPYTMRPVGLQVLGLCMGLGATLRVALHTLHYLLAHSKSRKAPRTQITQPKPASLVLQIRRITTPGGSYAAFIGARAMLTCAATSSVSGFKGTDKCYSIQTASLLVIDN